MWSRSNCRRVWNMLVLFALLFVASYFTGASMGDGNDEQLTKHREHMLLKKAMLHHGNRGIDSPSSNLQGELHSILRSGNEADMEPFKNIQQLGKEYFLQTYVGTDGEIYDLLTKFFWGMKNGLAIELGAADGVHNSQTKYLVDQLGWGRILIEAHPVAGPKLKSNAPEAISFHTAVCSNSRIVHYAMRGDVSGIVEFMQDSFIKEFHPELVNRTESEWGKFQHIRKIPCLPLANILKFINVAHVNYFLLDTEGAELDILKTIAWNEVKFDVISVETEKQYRPEGYEMNVTNYLSEKGYQYLFSAGRNSWYKHKQFEPSAVA